MDRWVDRRIKCFHLTILPWETQWMQINMKPMELSSTIAPWSRFWPRGYARNLKIRPMRKRLMNTNSILYSLQLSCYRANLNPNWVFQNRKTFCWKWAWLSVEYNRYSVSHRHILSRWIQNQCYGLHFLLFALSCYLQMDYAQNVQQRLQLRMPNAKYTFFPVSVLKPPIFG